MPPLHHIADDLLVEYAAAQPNEAVSLVVACHLALCPECRKVVGLLDEVGALYALADPPLPVDRSPLAAASSRLGTAERAVAQDPPSMIPAPLRTYVGTDDIDELAWTQIVPGHWRIALDVDAAAGHLFLGKFAPGFVVPHHGHTGRELVMALTGGFSQDGSAFAPGDVAFADQMLEHEVLVDADGDCIALVSNEVD